MITLDGFGDFLYPKRSERIIAGKRRGEPKPYGMESGTGAFGR